MRFRVFVNYLKALSLMDKWIADKIQLSHWTLESVIMREIGNYGDRLWCLRCWVHELAINISSLSSPKFHKRNKMSKK
jgi:hypothetical protein